MMLTEVWALPVIWRLDETDTKFDPNVVTPGFEGFLFTGLLAVGVIALGFLMVSRLRRNGYRSEVREQIAEELAGGAGSGRSGAETAGGSGHAGGADSGDSPDPELKN
jgi:hypothetical protein